MTVLELDRSDLGLGPVAAGYEVPHAQFKGLAIHHTVMVMADYDRDGFLHGDLDDVRRYMHVLKGARPDLGPDVPYSFVVFEGREPWDAIVCHGRGWGRTGAHTAGYNSTRYGVAIAGNTDARPVTRGMLDAIRWVGGRLANPAGAAATFGHFQVKATACPGASMKKNLPNVQPPFAGVAPTPAPVPSSTGGRVTVNVSLPVLRRGDRGPHVAGLQGLLNAKAGQGLAIDADFGAATEHAVRNVQAFFKITADGVAGAKTWTTLLTIPL